MLLRNESRPDLPKGYKDHAVKEPGGAECIREETKVYA